MSNEVSHVVPRQLSLPTRDMADLVAIYLNHVERESWNTTFIGVDIPAKDRTALSSRLCEIEAVCIVDPAKSKFERARIDKAISYMIGMFTVGRKVSELEAAGTVKGFIIALEGIPAHFVEQAALDFAKGRVGGHDNQFTPTSAEVRKYAESLMIPFREECSKIRMIISSKKRIKPTPAEHKRMLAKTLAVINGTDPDLKAMRDRIEADRREQLTRHTIGVARANEVQRRRDCAHYGVDPDGMVSPALMMKINGRMMKTKTEPQRKKANANTRGG